VVSSTAGSNKVAVLDAIIDLLNGIEDFRDYVFGGYHPASSISVDRFILVHLHRDVQVVHVTDEDIHELHFNVVVKYKEDMERDPKTTMDNFIDLVGKVEDKLKGYYSNPGTWEELTIDEIDYTFGRDRQFLFYNALMSVRVRVQW